MPTIINPLITDAGLTAAIHASAATLQLAITHIALGSGQYTPSVGQTALTNRKEKITVAGGFVSGTGGFRVNVAFPAWAGVPNPYNATEIGFYAGDPDAGGILFAVYSHPSSVIVQRNALDYVAQFGLQLSRVPAGSVTVTVDPGASQALALLSAHEAAADPHAPYASRAQLNAIMTAAGLTPDFTTASKLLTALRAAGVFATPAQFDNTTKAATTAFVKGAGFSASNITQLSATATLTAAAAGGLVYTVGASGFIVTLPVVSAVVGSGSGSRIEVFNGCSVPITVARQATDLFTVNNSAVTTLVLQPGDSLIATAYGGSWIISGSAQLLYAGSFGSSVATSGYQKLPSGLIIQWGTATSNASGVATFTHPITFPNNYFKTYGSYQSGTLAANITNFTPGLASSNGYICNTSGVAVNGAVLQFLSIGH